MPPITICGWHVFFSNYELTAAMSQKIVLCIIILLAIAGAGSYFFVFQPEKSVENTLEEPLNKDSNEQQQRPAIVTQKKMLVYLPPEKSLSSDEKLTVEDVEIQEKKEYSKPIEQLNNLELLYSLKKSLVEENSAPENDRLASELIERLRKTSDAEVIAKIAEFLSSNEIGIEQKGYLIKLLGKSGTVDAFKMLTSLIPQFDDEASRQQLAQAFTQFSDNIWYPNIFANNSPLLEEAWRSSSDDELLGSAVANTIAKTGDKNGIALLINSTERDTDYASGKNLLVGKALASANNPESIYFLGETLRNKESNQSAAYVSGYALAHNGNELAVKNLLDWASSATDEEGVMVDDWLRTALENNPSALKVVEREVENRKFDNQSVEGIVTALLFEYSNKATN